MIKTIISFNNKNINFSKSLGILFLSFIFYIIGAITLNYFLRKLVPLNQIKNNDVVYINFSTIIFLFIFGSILEELKYRLLITKFNLTFIAISLSVYLADILFLFFRPQKFSLFDKNISYIVFYYILFGLLSLGLYLVLKPILNKNKIKIHVFFKDNFFKIMIIQILLFALWHMFFTHQTANSSYIIIFILQSFAAIYFTFVRINFGIFYSISVHFLINIIFFILSA